MNTNLDNSSEDQSRAQEALDQLKEDLRQGESNAVEFKEYDFGQLGNKKLVNEWKKGLGKDMAALAPKGGRIYIGVSDGRQVRGVEGSAQDWDEKLIQRSVGAIQPAITYEIDLLEDPNTKASVIRVGIDKNGGHHSYNRVIYIRRGSSSYPIEPEDIPPAEGGDSDKLSGLLARILRIAVKVFVALNLYDEKNIKPSTERLGFSLEDLEREIEDTVVELQPVEDSEYYCEKLDALSSRIRFSLDMYSTSGPEYWAKKKESLQNILVVAEEVAGHITGRYSLDTPSLSEEYDSCLRGVLRWLKRRESRTFYSNFEDNAYEHATRMLEVYFALNNLNDLDKKHLEAYKDIADTLERLSWGRPYYYPDQIEAEIPTLIQKLEGLKPFEEWAPKT